MSERIRYLDYAKVIACILVVIGHVLISFVNSGITNSRFVDGIIFIIYIFHMPLFLMVSGYFYKIKESYFKTIKNKIINLGIPYLAFSIIYIIINSNVSGTNSSLELSQIPKIINYPIAQYWFLYALISLMIFVPIIDKIKNKKIVFLIFIIFHIISNYTNINLSIIGFTLKYGIFFWIGKYLINGISIIDSRKSIIVSTIVFIIGSTTLYFLQQLLPYFVQTLLVLLLAIIGSISVLSISKVIKENKKIDFLSEYYFYIYLLHVFFAAATRIILLKLGITNLIIHFVLGCLTGIIGPIIAGIISKKIKYTEILFYPTKTIKQFKELKNEKN